MTERQFAFRPYSLRADSIIQPNDQTRGNKPRSPKRVLNEYRRDAVMKFITLEQLLDPPENITEAINTPSFVHQLAQLHYKLQSLQTVNAGSQAGLRPDTNTINHKNRVAILERFVRGNQPSSPIRKTMDIQAFIDEQVTKQNRQKNR